MLRVLPDGKTKLQSCKSCIERKPNVHKLDQTLLTIFGNFRIKVTLLLDLTPFALYYCYLKWILWPDTKPFDICRIHILSQFILCGRMMTHKLQEKYSTILYYYAKKLIVMFLKLRQPTFQVISLLLNNKNFDAV